MNLTVFCNTCPKDDEDQPEMSGSTDSDADSVTWDLNCPKCKTEILITLHVDDVYALINHD